jgi:hypothetical protein
MQSLDAIGRIRAGGLLDLDSDVSRNRNERRINGHLLVDRDWLNRRKQPPSPSICFKRSTITLSEFAEKLEKRRAAESVPDEGNYMSNLPRC